MKNVLFQGIVLHSHMHMHIYTYTCRIHIDAVITSEDFFKKIYLSFYLKVFEKGNSRFYCERELETEQNCNIWTLTLMAISVVSFSFSRVAQPEAWGPSSLLDAGFLYRILSPTGLQTGLQTNWLPVFTELYNSSIAHSISLHNWPSGCITSAVLGMAYLAGSKVNIQQ